MNWGARKNLLREAQDICFSILANDEHSAQNCPEIASADLFFVEWMLAMVKVVPRYTVMIFVKRSSATALNVGKCMVQLPSCNYCS